MSMYFLLFSKLWSVLNESIPEAVICISDLFYKQSLNTCFLPFQFLNKDTIYVSQNKGIMYKIGSA